MLNSFEEYHFEIKKIWKEPNLPNLIIPFCTPMKLRPKFLVIGLNHSDFSPKNRAESNRIAMEFSAAMPKENTYISHQHPFAEGLRKIITKVHNEHKDFDYKPTKEWVGTNKIALQSDSESLKKIIMKHERYKDCEEKMNELLISLIKFMKPKNVLLAGIDATYIFPFYKDRKLKDMEYRKFELDDDSNETTNLIPLHHFSLSTHYELEANRLKKAIGNGYCDC